MAALAGSVICASLALAETGLEMYDLPVACSLVSPAISFLISTGHALVTGTYKHLYTHKYQIRVFVYLVWIIFAYCVKICVCCIQLVFMLEY